jgi:hypothetical protein
MTEFDEAARANAFLDAVEGGLGTLSLIGVADVLSYAQAAHKGDMRALAIIKGVQQLIEDVCSGVGDGRKLCACCNKPIEGYPGLLVLLESDVDKAAALMFPTHSACSAGREGSVVLAEVFAYVKQHFLPGARSFGMANIFDQGGRA